MKVNRLNKNLPLFYIYKCLDSFILDSGIWMLFLLSKGFSLSLIALLESAYHCSKFLLEIPTGYIADRYGKRVSMLLAQASGAAAAGLLLWGENVWTIAAGFILGGLAGTFQSGAATAFIYESLQETGRVSVFRKINSWLSGIALASMGIGGIVGGFLSDLHWNWVYAGKVLLHLMALAVLLLMKEPDGGVSSENEGSQAKASFKTQMNHILNFIKGNSALTAMILSGALLYSMAWSISFYSQVIFQFAGLSNRQIGIINGLETWIAAGAAAIAFIGDRWLGRTGSLMLSGIGYMVSLIIFTVQRQPAGVISSYFAMSVLISYLEPLLESYLNELLPSVIRATMLSVFSMLISAGMMVTFSLIGILGDALGLHVALKIAAAIWSPLCVVSVVWTIKQLRHYRKP